MRICSRPMLSQASLQAQIETRDAFANLKANPLAFLGQYKVTVGGLPGTDTASGLMGLSMTGNHLRIGSRSFLRAAGVPGDSVLTRQMLYTPMRSNTMVGRTGATRRFQAGANELWVTTRQTGCSVLILDWGPLGFSMVHLQPHAAEQFNPVARRLLEQNSSLNASTKNYYLRQEGTAVANATGGGGAPQRYLLVQSCHIAPSGHLQIIGIRNGLGWNFYSQFAQRGGTYSSRALQWQVWSSWRPYVAAYS